MSRNESFRRVCHAMPTQSFTSHSLKRLKLLSILGSVLILWGGFISTTHAGTGDRYRVVAENHLTGTDYVYVRGTYLPATQHSCDRYVASRNASQTNWIYRCKSASSIGHFFMYQIAPVDDPSNFSAGRSNSYAVDYSDSNYDDCTTSDPFNPATGICDVNYTPPPPPPPLIPPEKNFGNECIGGSNSSGPSALVGK